MTLLDALSHDLWMEAMTDEMQPPQDTPTPESTGTGEVEPTAPGTADTGPLAKSDSAMAVLCFIYGVVVGLPLLVASLIFLLTGTFIGIEFGGGLVFVVAIAGCPLAIVALVFAASGVGSLLQKPWGNSCAYRCAMILVAVIIGAFSLQVFFTAANLPGPDFTLLKTMTMFASSLAIGVVSASVPLGVVWRHNRSDPYSLIGRLRWPTRLPGMSRVYFVFCILLLISLVVAAVASPLLVGLFVRSACL